MSHAAIAGRGTRATNLEIADVENSWPVQAGRRISQAFAAASAGSLGLTLANIFGAVTLGAAAWPFAIAGPLLGLGAIGLNHLASRSIHKENEAVEDAQKQAYSALEDDFVDGFEARYRTQGGHMSYEDLAFVSLMPDEKLDKLAPVGAGPDRTGAKAGCLLAL